MLGYLYLRASSTLHCKRFLAVICVQCWAGTKMMHPNSACQWQIESSSPGKFMNNPATMHIFLQNTLHLLSFWPQWHQWTPPEAWEKKILLKFTLWSSTCFEFFCKFSRIRNEVQHFGSALLITIANTSLLEGEKILILVEPNNKGNDHEFLQWLQGARAVKEDQKSTKLKKCVLHAQVRATTYMAIAMLKLKKALEDQSTLQLFTMFEKLIMTHKVCEYFLLCKYERVENLWQRMGHTLNFTWCSYYCYWHEHPKIVTTYDITTPTRIEPSSHTNIIINKKQPNNKDCTYIWGFV